MKLSKIYADGLFHNVEFRSGINVVIGKISNRKDNERDTHNLGKSLLLEVIDFLLLKGIPNKEKYFLTKNTLFSQYTFFAEIELHDGTFLIIKRSVENNTKISFKENKNKLASFDTTIQDWDEVDLALEKAKKKLNSYLGFNILPHWDFRKSLNYFMRHQEDYVDVFKLSKFKGPHKDWKPMVFDLLGFDGSLIKQKLDLEEEYQKLKEKIKILETENKVSQSDEDKIRGLIDIKRDELSDVSSKIDVFNFCEQDNKQKDMLVEDIENKIKIANTQHYAVKHEISKIERALESKIDNIDLEEIKTLYSEVEIFFPNSLLLEFQKVIDFNQSITSERNIFLKENLSKLKQESIELNTLLEELETEKSNILVNLTDKNSYDKFKTYQKQLSKIEAETLILEDKLHNISQMVQMEEMLNTYSAEIKERVLDISKAITQQHHKHIRKLFNEFTMKILNTPAILSVKLNGENNVEFEAEYQSKNNLGSSDLASGNTYRKILCAAFDISLLQNYNSASFYKFVFHDGVLDTLDVRKKENYIKFIRDLASNYNIQYIFTAIESEINQLQDEYKIHDDEICLILSDDSSDEKLFKQDF